MIDRKKIFEQVPEIAPEMEIILHSISVSGNKEVLVGELIEKGIDWNRLEKLAAYHKVLPLLYKQLSKIDNALLPQEETKRLKSIYKSNAIHNLRQAQNLHRVLELLSQNRIEVIPFKGPILTVQAYGDLYLRTFTDLDLLIHTKDLGRIYDIITAAGFRSSFTLNEKMKQYWMLFRRNCEFSNGTGWIDFHHQITQGPERISLKEKAWQNKCSVDLLSWKIPALSPEHSLLCLCVHGTKEHWRFIRIMADISHLISRHPDLNWETVIADAKELGVLRMLSVGLQLSNQVCKVGLPAKVEKLVHKDRRAGRLTDHYFQQLFAPYTKTGKLYEILAFIKSLDSTALGITFLSHFIFTPTPIDWKAIKLPAFLYPLYYVIRPFRLCFKLLFMPFNYLLKKTKKTIP